MGEDDYEAQLGRMAFEVFCASRLHNQPEVSGHPEWDDLGPVVRQAWIDVAHHIRMTTEQAIAGSRTIQ